MGVKILQVKRVIVLPFSANLQCVFFVFGSKLLSLISAPPVEFYQIPLFDKIKTYYKFPREEIGICGLNAVID